MNALYKQPEDATIYYCDVEELAKRLGLELSQYGDPSDTNPHEGNSYLTHAIFTNAHNNRRKKDKTLEVFYYMNKIKGLDKWIAGKIYSIEVEGIDIAKTKSWGGLFPDIPRF